jgi:DNA-binding response OmpR family regulator
MEGKLKVLLAEDEQALGMIVKESLESRNIDVLWCENGQTAFIEYQKFHPDVLVLDVMMPLKDGFTLAEEIRIFDQNIPILFLTAKSQTKDVVNGFKVGGNDYVRKPFSMEEMIVRIHELAARREKKIATEIIRIGQYQFNYPKQQLLLAEDVQLLTHREGEVLVRLANKPNELVDRSVMLREIWGNDDFFNARSMDVFITKLRKKLADDPDVQILNVRGYGYKLVF